MDRSKVGVSLGHSRFHYDAVVPAVRNNSFDLRIGAFTGIRIQIGFVVSFLYVEKGVCMKQRKTVIAMLVVLIIVLSGGYFGLSSVSVRTVDFLSIFSIGALTGLLLQQIAMLMKGGDSN